MDWTYSCPHCGAALNPNVSIVLRARREEKTILVGLHPQPGNYEVVLPPGEAMQPGSRWDFSCPVCDHSLVSELSDELCAIDMCSQGERHRVYFSRVAGEEATFVVSAEGMLTDHGVHTDQYLEHMVHRKYMR
jgi:transcription elongation factor Elf1